MADRTPTARRLAFGATAVALLLAFAQVAFPFALRPGLLALNFIEAAPGLATSGMPSRDQFESIAAARFDMIVNLAPEDSLGAHEDEDDVVRSLGMRYAALPIDFRKPSPADYERFAAIMNARPTDARTLVHCQLNMRASSFVFLYRVIELGEPVDSAYDSVLAIWRPNAAWSGFMRGTLRRHGKPLPLGLETA
jgi:protein tyrosine phosphatase (PTP) superfamily phosphohydrolase (DUF442 family)